MRSTQIIFVLATVFLAESVMAQPGPPTADVSVVNTPDVNIVNTPSVEISNSPTVQIGAGANFRDRDNPALQPVQFTCEVTLANLVQIDGIICGTLPLGKRLVIEYINARAVVPNGQRPTMRLSVTNKDLAGAISSIDYRYFFDDCGPIGPADTCHTMRERVRLYHTQFNVVLEFNRSGPFTDDATLTASFSGYLVDNI